MTETRSNAAHAAAQPSIWRIPRTAPQIGGIWQFVYCASCGARGDGDPMDARGARDRWNRGPVQIRTEVA